MNEGQKQFLNFILERVKEENIEQATALLKDSFERQATGRFDVNHINSFNNEIATMLMPEYVDEILGIIKDYGKHHISK